jgi:hypothetical protein
MQVTYALCVWSIYVSRLCVQSWHVYGVMCVLDWIILHKSNCMFVYLTALLRTRDSRYVWYLRSCCPATMVLTAVILHADITHRLQIQMYVKKVTCAVGQYVKWAEGFTTKKKIYWDQAHIPVYASQYITPVFLSSMENLCEYQLIPTCLIGLV